LKRTCLAILIAVISLIFVSLAQNIDVTGTPSQGAFEVGVPYTFPATETPSLQAYRIGTPQNVPGTETPSQQAYQTGSNQTASGAQPGFAAPAAAGAVSIYNVVREGDGLLAMLINGGTTSVNMTSWKLSLNNGSAIYTIPNFALEPGALVTVHPQAGTNTSTDLFGSNFGWNETKDLELLDGSGVIVSEYALMPV
jgi:hypothetical protein